jgi:hypothetical protein
MTLFRHKCKKSSLVSGLAAVRGLLWFGDSAQVNFRGCYYINLTALCNK